MEHGQPSTKPVERLTFTEATEALTGWDEIAIEKASGYSIEQMSGDSRTPPRALLLTRCVAAVHLSRDKGLKYGEAYNEVMGWAQGRVQAMFEDEPDDVLPDEPDSEVGKGGSGPAPEQTSWQISASEPGSPPAPTTET
jgi:hypothetical protein